MTAFAAGAGPPEKMMPTRLMSSALLMRGDVAHRGGMRIRRFLPMLLLTLVTSCHRPRIPQGGKYRVTLSRLSRHLHASALPQCAAVTDVAVTDDRGTDVLGDQLVEYAPPDQLVPVVSVNDPRGWLADVARAVGSDSAIRFGRGGGALTLKLRKLTASETWNGIMGAMYRSRVVFDATLGAGKGAFTGTFDSDAEQYGADQSMENMLEVVNQAAEQALVRMYDDPGFRSAVCGGATTTL
jgi:hypothetical protein